MTHKCCSCRRDLDDAMEEIERLQDEKAILEMEAVGYKQEIECANAKLKIAVDSISTQKEYYDSISLACDDCDFSVGYVCPECAIIRNTYNTIAKIAALDSRFENSEWGDKKEKT